MLGVVLGYLFYRIYRLLSDPVNELILSGMLAEQEAAVTEAAAAQKLRVVGRHMEEDWMALIVER